MAYKQGNLYFNIMLVVTVFACIFTGCTPKPMTLQNSPAESSISEPEPHQSEKPSQQQEESVQDESWASSLSIFGSWTREAAIPGMNSSVSQIDFFQDGTVHWYEHPGCDNVLKGTYVAYRGKDALDKIGQSMEDYEKWKVDNAWEIHNQFRTFTLPQLFYLEVSYSSYTKDGVTEEIPPGMRVDYYHLYLAYNGDYALTYFFSSPSGGGNPFHFNRIEDTAQNSDS